MLAIVDAQSTKHASIGLIKQTHHVGRTVKCPQGIENIHSMCDTAIAGHQSSPTPESVGAIKNELDRQNSDAHSWPARLLHDHFAAGKLAGAVGEGSQGTAACTERPAAGVDRRVNEGHDSGLGGLRTEDARSSPSHQRKAAQARRGHDQGEAEGPEIPAIQACAL